MASRYIKIINSIIDKLEYSNKKVDREKILKAFEFSKKAHANLIRRSGAPYIEHPVMVADILSDMKVDDITIISALLHDVVEDTEYTLGDIEKEFGLPVKIIIDGLTKIKGAFNSDSSLQVSTFRKLILTLAEDVRVILIKLADRLHNMRTLSALPQKKQIKISSETLYLYAPLAHRLGLYTIKTELEDLSLKYKNPEVYRDIADRISHSEKISAHFLNKFIDPIRAKLDEQGFEYDISGRPKSIYSVWHKMQTKNLPFEQIFDFLAVRINFKAKQGIAEKTQCWFIYSLITDLYLVKPDRIRDWVSHPKANGYEALHATVMGPHGKWVEVQIRSERMNEIAEKGFAAHWKYKSDETREGELDKWIKKASDMLQSQEVGDIEFLEDFKLNLFESEIVTFTPKGKEISLPKGSTALDFAYEIHTQVGHTAIGAKVNHRLVPLSYKLTTGDQVEILTSKIQTPQYEWLGMAKTARAKTAIKSVFKEQRLKDISKGQMLVEEKLKELNYRPNASVFRKMFEEYEVSSKDDLYLKLGKGIVNLENLKKVLKKRSKNKQVKFWNLQFLSRKTEDPDEESENQDPSETFLLREDQDEMDYKLANCCEPIPGDEIIGYQNPDSTGIIIHKSKCPTALKLISSQDERIIQAKWTSHKVMAHLARIKLHGIDRMGMANELTEKITTQLSVNIRSMTIETRDGIFEGSFDLYVHNTEDLNNLIMIISKIKGVESVTRVEKSEES